MKKSKVIKIAHLYYDLMNLYGETGNIKALVKKIENQSVTAEVHFLTIGDKIDFNKYDIYYMGAGSEENENMVIEDLKKYKSDIKSAIENDRVFLITGNAMEIFGKKVHLNSGRSLECLGIFDYQGFEENKRLVSEIAYKYDELPKDKGNIFLAFKNTRCNMKHLDNTMFGFSDSMRYKNFFTMNLIGPVLVRNPYFTDYFLEIVFEKNSLEYKKNDTTLDYKAYHEFIKNFCIQNK